MKFKVPDRFRETKAFHTLQHHWLTIAFILGFISDNLTLNRVDQVFDQAILFFYVVLAAATVLLLYAGTAGKLSDQWNKRARQIMPGIIQYAFGGLLSGMLIFYGRSGAWAASWPFLLIIIGAIYFNETIEDRVTRMIYNLTIFFVGLFSYVVLVIPVLTGHMGAWVFAGSGLVALFIMYLFLRLVHLVIPNFLQLHMRLLVFFIGCVYAGFNFLYFTNIIPPIPLSLKEVGIYHSVIKLDNGNYVLKYEEGKWWQLFRNSDTVFHAVTGDNIYCFARIYAPGKLQTDIVHVFQFYDPETNKWEDTSSTSYSIAGGRVDGYRGYTLTGNYRDGKWRCSIETVRGQILGREVFWVDSTVAPATLKTREE